MKNKRDTSDIQHFIVFNRLVMGGYLWHISHSALKVYLAIKVFTTTKYEWSDCDEPMLLAISEKSTFPSYSKISELTGVCRQTIAKAIRELSEVGLFSYERGNSFKRANQYFLNSPNNWLPLDQIINQSKKGPDDLESNGTTNSSENEKPVVVSLDDSNQSRISHSIHTLVSRPNAQTQVTNTAGVEPPAPPGQAGCLGEEKPVSPDLPARSKTKSRLWSSVQRAGKSGQLNAGLAAKKLTSVSLTEGLASDLASKLESGDFTWFEDCKLSAIELENEY